MSKDIKANQDGRLEVKDFVNERKEQLEITTEITSTSDRKPQVEFHLGLTEALKISTI